MFEKKYTYDDVALIPSYSNVDSRLDPKTDTWLTKDLKISFPVVNSPMDTVISFELADLLLERGGMPIFNRFTSLEKYREVYNKYGNKVIVSTCVNNLDEIKSIVDLGFDKILLDTASGHTKRMLNTLNDLHKYRKGLEILAGNVCTAQGTLDLINSGANAVRVGIGGGCFVGNTKILMSTGTYKNIKDIEIGEYVINKFGKPVKVIAKKNSGFKEVIKLKTKLWYDPTYVTPEHNYWLADLHNYPIKPNRRNRNQSFKDILKRKNCSIGWVPISSITNGDYLALFPDKIDFYNPHYDKKIHFDYTLGYILGTFLGDGSKEARHNRVHWHFGLHERRVVDKLVSCLKNKFKEHISSYICSKGNTIVVSISSKKLRQLVEDCGIRNEKHLPESLLYWNKEYALGLFDGLIDSDGHTREDRSQKRYLFANTSKTLIELFVSLCIYLDKSYCCSIRDKEKENLKQARRDIPIKFNHDLLTITTHTNKKSNGEVVYSTIPTVSSHPIIMETFDIEVDCPTHSFIANGSIVHNSACTTRIQTSVGMPQFSAVYDCAKEAKRFKIPVMADGAIKGPREVCLAIAAGATTVMIGKLFSLTKESAAIKKDFNGILKAHYRGQASEDFQRDHYNGVKKGTIAEGIDFWAPVTESANKLLDDLLAGLRSSMTYLGAKTIKEYQEKATFVEVSNTYMMESYPRVN